jgi:hypothetical protein
MPKRHSQHDFGWPLVNRSLSLRRAAKPTAATLGIIALPLLRSVLEYLNPPPLRDRATLARFLSGEASYLAQRSTYEFSRNTLAWFGQWMFHDPKFNEAFAICRWESFAAILADMVVLTEGTLRPHARSPAALAQGLVALYAQMLQDYPLPAHRPEGWADAIELMESRLRDAAEHARMPDPSIMRFAVRKVYESLPVQSENSAADFAAIDSAIRMGTISFHDRLRQRASARELVTTLVVAETAPPRDGMPVTPSG